MTRQTPTNRQLAASVRFNRKVTVEAPDLGVQQWTGYVVGFDDEDIHLGVVRGGRVDRHTFNRSFIGRIQFHPESTLSRESPPVKEELESQLRTVRHRVNEEFFPDRQRAAKAN